MTKIAFIGCVKQKQKGMFKAKDLYTSDLFKKTIKYTNAKYDKTYILSAKYGVISLDQEIPYYDETLNTMKKKEREQWAEKVANQINKILKPEDEYYIFAGKKYYENLLYQIKNKNCTIVMENLSIGKRLQWLKVAILTINEGRRKKWW